MLFKKNMTPIEYYEYFEELEKIEREAKILLYQEEYYDMLINLLKSKFSISDLDKSYQNGITREEKNIIRYISCLFKIIDEYAKKNYIYSENCNESNTEYYIKYKDTYFIIGAYSDTDNITYNYCVLTEKKINKIIINIEDVINNKNNLDPLNIKNDLQEFENNIFRLVQKGVPPIALKETFKRVLK